MRMTCLPTSVFSRCSLLLGIAAVALAVTANAWEVGDKIWEDQFDGNELNTDVWTYDLGGGGWGNDELQEYTTGNVKVEDGVLHITATGNAADGYKSGRIKSQPGFQFKYGTLIARIKVPNVNAGLWPAFWTLGENFDQVSWPASGEIDIMEMGQGLAISQGMVNRRVISAAHWERDDAYKYDAHGRDFDADLTGEYHKYKLEWDKYYLRTYMDGILVWEFDITDTPERCNDCSEFHQFHFIMLNLAVGGRFTYAGEEASSSAGSVLGACEDSSAVAGPCGVRNAITAPVPATMEVDFVRLFANADTEIRTVDTPAPVAPTDAPVAPTDAPVAPTDAPVAPTDAPVTPTAPPLGTVDRPPTPVAPTDAPAAPTDAPVTPTAPPLGTVDRPPTPTEAPVGPTIAPIGTTNPPPTTPPGNSASSVSGKGKGGKAGSKKSSKKSSKSKKSKKSKRAESADNLSLFSSELNNVPSAGSRFKFSMVVYLTGLVGILMAWTSSLI